MIKVPRVAMKQTNNFPKVMKMFPIVPTTPNLAGFLKIRKKASFAAMQKLFPVIEIYRRNYEFGKKGHF